MKRFPTSARSEFGNEEKGEIPHAKVEETVKQAVLLFSAIGVWWCYISDFEINHSIAKKKKKNEKHRQAIIIL